MNEKLFQNLLLNLKQSDRESWQVAGDKDDDNTKTNSGKSKIRSHSRMNENVLELKRLFIKVITFIHPPPPLESFCDLFGIWYLG